MPMLLKQKPFRNALGMLLVIISLASVSSPQETANHLNTIAIVRIKNFGQMDNRFYRGGQPNEKDLQRPRGVRHQDCDRSPRRSGPF